MSGLDPACDPDEVRAVLVRLLKSESFKRKTRLSPLLQYLVEKKIAGGDSTEITQDDLAKDVWKRDDFDPATDTLVRTSVSELRALLHAYADSEGKDDPIRILLPDEGYVVIFERHAAIEPQPVSVGTSPATVPPARAIPFWKTKAFLAGISFSAGLLVVGWWLSHDRHCGEGMQITLPIESTPVGSGEVIRGTRTPREWLCRCKDFVAVEPVDLRTWYVQDRLLDGQDWSVTARFGDPTTASGTRFNVFVVSTTGDLPRGPIDPSSKLLKGAKTSKSVVVTLRRSL